jgi:hypothetical protein
LIEKGTPARNIAVLYRANFQSRAIEEAFIKKNIPYQLVGVRFFERKEVKDVLSYIRASLNRESWGDIGRIINVPTRGIGKATVAKIMSGRPDLLPPAMKAKIENFWKLLEDIRAEIMSKRPSEAVKFVIQESGMERVLLSGTMYIGVRSTGDEGINGIIDDFRVYDYALTSTQVSNIVSGSDNPDVAASSSASSSAAGGGANMPVWLLNLRQQNNLTPYGTIASASSSSSASQASSSSSASSLSMQSSSASSLASSATSSSASSHSAAPALSVNPFQQRICSRVLRWFVTETSALSRLNSRLLKRFGFECR